ncbi:MAG: hypothetical protein CVU41_08230 [Chloroflexi bacterium HGW-Chloroflexi-3]|nr:MAG: hypothetical protein CVU41_08230 [Chloroflexi bacterium HGW-Chloroflexi-3]
MKTKTRIPILSLITISLLVVSISVTLSHLSSVNAESATILSTYPSWFFNGKDSGENMGSAVSGVGDVNGDGKADVLVGAQKHTLTLYREGAAFLFYSSGGGLSSFPDWKMGSGQQGAMFGCATDYLGDVNSDGYDDVVIGACEYNLLDGSTVAISKVGAAYVYYGGQNFNAKTSADWSLLGDQADAKLGSAVSGYINDHQSAGVKYADLLVGTPFYNSEEKTNNGRVSLYLGSASGLATASVWEVFGENSAALFGSAVDNAGDVNGDGYDDVIIGAPRPTNIGYAYVYQNSDSGLTSSFSWRGSDEKGGSSFGATVAGVGDVNNDGYDDVLVGAPNKKVLIDGTYQSTGCVFLYLGSSSGLVTTPSWEKCSNQPGSMFGASVAAAGDMNGDGYADFLVGVPFYSVSNEKQGAVYLFFGSSGSIGVKGDYYESTYGNKADTEFGTSVSSAGDVNNDGLLDVIVGAPNYKASGFRVGRAMTYYAGIPGIPDVEIFTVFLPNILK